MELYENRHWRNAAYGGNRWASITRCVRDLRDAFERGDVQVVLELVERIPEMSHNTGKVGDKLHGLRSAG